MVNSMCRLLFVRSENEFNPIPHLKAFSDIALSSKEYQGHGWGCAYLISNEWNYYKNIQPIWKDDFSFLNNQNVSLILVHARSAFQNEGIVVENNMPFSDGQSNFIFNGELHGVKIKEEGRIGAEKIFNYIKRFTLEPTDANYFEGFKKGISIIQKRTKHIRGMNIIMVNNRKAYVSSMFNEDPDYFSLHVARNKEKNIDIICSQPYDIEATWEKIENNSFLVV